MTSHINLRRIIWFSVVQWSGSVGNEWRRGFSLKQFLTELTPWTLKYVSSHLCIHVHIASLWDPVYVCVCVWAFVIAPCVSEQANLRVCLCAQFVSRFVFLLPRQSYWPRSIFSRGGRSQTAWEKLQRDVSLAWKEVNIVTEMCCEQDNKNWTSCNVSGGRGGWNHASVRSKHLAGKHTHTPRNAPPAVCSSYIFTSVNFPFRHVNKVTKKYTKTKQAGWFIWKWKCNLIQCATRRCCLMVVFYHLCCL